MIEFITAKEVANITRLSLWTIRTLCSQKRIPFFKIGRRVIFDPVEIDEWRRRNKVQEREISKSKKAKKPLH